MTVKNVSVENDKAYIHFFNETDAEDFFDGALCMGFSPQEHVRLNGDIITYDLRPYELEDGSKNSIQPWMDFCGLFLASVDREHAETWNLFSGLSYEDYQSVF